MKASKTLIITGVFALLAVAAICYYALMQFAEEKYSFVLKDSSLEIVDFAIEDKEEIRSEWKTSSSGINLTLGYRF